MSSCGVAASADGVGHSGLVLYVNGEYRDDSDIGKLMHDFNCTSADDMNFEILAEKTRDLRGNPKGVSEMCKVMEDLRDESYAEGHAEGREEQAQMTAKNLYEQGLTIEQIARAIGFSMETVEKWLTQKAGKENNRNGQCIVRFAYDMLALLFDGSQRQSEVGWGWLKIWGQGVILAEGKSYLFSPVRDKICIWKTKQVILKVGSSI